MKSRRPIRIRPSDLPPPPPRPPPREGLLFPWILATFCGAMTLLLIAMALGKFGVLPLTLYPFVADAIAGIAVVSVLAGCLAAFFRRRQYIARHKNPALGGGSSPRREAAQERNRGQVQRRSR